MQCHESEDSFSWTNLFQHPNFWPKEAFHGYKTQNYPTYVYSTIHRHTSGNAAKAQWLFTSKAPPYGFG